MPDRYRGASGVDGKISIHASGSRLAWPCRFTLLATVCVAFAACGSEQVAKTDPTNGLSAIQATAGAGLARGRVYADNACASCHAVAPGQVRSPNPKAPTFTAIAKTPGMTLMAFNVWLHTSHPTMPNLIIAPDEIEALSAYLYTLK